jgi:hypothetical protein
VGEFQTILAIVNVTHLLLGIFYAWQIYLAPSPHGWTWVSVGAGTLILLFGMMFNGFIFYHFNSLNITTFLLLPLAALITAGLPMVLVQGFRKWQEDRQNDKFIKGEGIGE